jgi:hypothetical protein
VTDEVQLIASADPEISEEWLRETDEPEIRGVGAGYTEEDGWFVDIWAQEFFRQDPLGVELRERVQAALRAVDGVTRVEEGDNESWQVTGNASGEALVQAAARIVDDMADRMREAALLEP